MTINIDQANQKAIDAANQALLTAPASEQERIQSFINTIQTVPQP